MKNSKAISITLCIALLISTSVFTQTAEKTLVKSFNLKGNQLVILDLAGQVEIIDWSNDLMRMNMTVSLENGNEGMLKSLVQVGRYNLNSEEEDSGLLVNAPNLQRQITVRGNEIKENISYIVYKPENVEVQLLNEISSSKESVNGTSSM